MTNEQVWLITGASTGIGQSLVKALLKKNYKVVATARNTDVIKEYTKHFNDLENLLILSLDVTNQSDIDTVFTNVIEKFGKIDVLVNNAGFAYFSPIEGAEDEQIKKMFDVNFWGVKHMIDHAVPIMKKCKSGKIVNISSLGGLRAFSGFGYYHATKFALEGMSESLYHELKPLGIDTVLIEPGDFNTDFAGRSAVINPKILSEYSETAGSNINNLLKLSGNQPGDPDKAAEAIIQILLWDRLPIRMLLGTDAYQRALEKMEDMMDTFKENENFIKSTDY